MSKTKTATAHESSAAGVSKQPDCYAILGKNGMYFAEICVCEDRESMEEILEELREDEPDEKYRVVGLRAC